MPIYNVAIREVHISHREVKASSPEEAKKLAEDAEEVFLEYSHTLDSENTTVEELTPIKSKIKTDTGTIDITILPRKD